MKKSDLELRIRELELELSNIKSDVASKRTAKSTSEESGAKFLGIANHINALIAYVDADTLRYEFVNDLYEKTLGIPKEKIIGSHLKDIIGETNFKFVLKHLKVVKSGKTASYENAYDLNYGKRWIKVNYTPVFDDYSKVVGIAMVSNDITERKQAEYSLHETEENYKIMFESSPIAINITRGENIFYANPSYLKMFGFLTMDELKNIAPLDLFTPEWRPKIEENIQRRAKGLSVSDSYEAECFRKDGSKFPILMYLTRTMFSDSMATVAFIIDITERKQADELLKESKERLQNIFNYLQDAYFEADLNGYFTIVSPSVKSMYGYESLDELIGIHAANLYANPGEREELINLLKVNGSVVDFRGVGKRKNGTTFWASMNVQFKHDSFGQNCGTIGVVRDITQRKLAEDTLQESEEKYRMLHENAGIGIGYYKVDGTVISYNRIAAQNLNGVPEDFIGKSIYDIFPKQEAFFYHDRIKKAALSEKPEVYEDLVKLSLENRYFLSTFSKICDANNNILGIQILSQDITKRKQVEVELIKAKEKAEENSANITAIIEGTKESIWAFNNNYEILYINKTFQIEFQQTFGVWLEPGVNLIESHPEHNRPFWKKRYDRVLTNEQFTVEDTVETGNGLIYVHITFNPIVKNGEVTGGSCIGSNITYRKLAEQELINAKEKAEESEIKFHSMFTAMQEGVYLHEMVYDKKGKAVNYRIIEANPISEKYLNIKIDLAVGKLATELYRTDNAPFLDVYAKVAETAEPVTFEQYFQPMDKHFSISVFSPKKGEFATIFQDITDKKKQESELQHAKEKAEESEHKLRIFFNTLAEGVSLNEIVYDTNNEMVDYRILEVNKAFFDVADYSSSDVIGNVATKVYGMSTESIREFWHNHKNKRETALKEFQSPLNQKWFYISTSPFENNRFVTSLFDITDIKNSELALIKAKEKAEENEIKFRNLFENSPIGKSMTGIDGSLHVNKSFSEIVGYSEEELKGQKWKEISYPEDIPLSNEKFQFLLDGELELARFEKRYIHKKGNIVWVDISIYLQRDKENKPQFFITTIVDITARKNFENELIKAKDKAEESDRLKSAFLTNMSHEIRTPMNGILGFTELLKEPHLTVEEQQDFIQTIQISGARMLNTINSIVDISKIESGLIGVDIKETNLNEKIEFIYKFFKPEVENKGLQFFFKYGLTAKESIIKTDNEKVYGILTNLVRNAIKFTSDGSIEFGYEKKNEYLEFFVKDTGVGIPHNQHEIIFERFRQGSDSNNRGYEGSGLGLSISKSYVEMLGGRIWVESEEGLGSTFYFTIPYIAVSVEKTTIENVVSVEPKEIQLNNMKILIVEDDEISYSLLSRTLQKISNEVLHVITGVQAVEACRNNPDLDLVLMDIRMPQMNGLEATQQIRQFNKDVIIIAQTAYAFTGDSEKAIEAGCNDYISKPIDATLLFELIRKHCSILNRKT